MKIGFACKWVAPSTNEEHLTEVMNTKTTTITWLNRQTKSVAESRLADIVKHNAKAVYNQIAWVAKQPEMLRMLRTSSDLLPAYTHPNWRYYYKENDFSKLFEPAGTLARQHGVRLSFHPGQYVVLASADAGIVERSIEEFEYHATVASWMGYGKTFQDFKCNVHLSGKNGPDGFRATYTRLTPEARNIITLENDEVTCGVDTLLTVSDIVPVVLDVHHHFVKENEYITPQDDRVQRVIDSWRGKRPTMHYSYSRDEFLTSVPADELPCVDKLKLQGIAKSRLRAHSELYPNAKANEWALSFLPNFDIMCEAKMKNIASRQLYEQHLLK